MQEINIRGNKTGLKVFINGEPDLKFASQEELNVIGTVLDIVISKQYENYIKRKEREPPKNKKVSAKTDT